MPYVPGEHYVRCAQCQKRVFHSLTVVDRLGWRVCKDHVDKRQVDIDFPRRPIPQDPPALDARLLQIEGADVFYSRQHWEDVDLNWEDVNTDWEAT